MAPPKLKLQFPLSLAKIHLSKKKINYDTIVYFFSMMASATDNFSSWLGNKLKDLNTDENVFGSYITGILDSDETNDEKNEALQGILSEIMENVGLFCKLITYLTKSIRKCNTMVFFLGKRNSKCLY